MLKAVIIRHSPFEGVGAIAAWLNGRHAEVRTVRMDLDEALPANAGFDLAVVMGGPMSANDNRIHPWLARERSWLRERIRADAPLLGVCLGAQQIAATLGAQIRRGPHEIGWFDIAGQAVPNGNFAFPERLRCFHWHGDTFELPPGAHRLASSAACTEQAFQYGRRTIALQCHLEATPRSVSAFVEKFAAELAAGGDHVQDPASMQDVPDHVYDTMHATLNHLLDYLTT